MIYSLDDKIQFGKYTKPVKSFASKNRSKKIKWIIKNDPQYLGWCVKNVDIHRFELDTQAKEALIIALFDLNQQYREEEYYEILEASGFNPNYDT